MTAEPHLDAPPQVVSFPSDHHDLDARVRRLEDQLATLRTQQAAATHTTDVAPINPLASVAGMVLPMLARFGGTGPVEPTAKLGFFTEFRLMARMYVDPHYRVSRIAQFGVPIILILMVLNNLFWPGIPLLTPILMQLTLVILSIALYKLLSREATRYAEVLAYLNRHGRGAR